MSSKKRFIVNSSEESYMNHTIMG